MKIVQVIHSYYPKIGGIELAVQHLAEEQVRLGHQVTVLTAIFGENNGPKEEFINGVKVLRLASKRFLYNDLIIPIEIPTIDADIVHAHSQNSFFSTCIAQKLKENAKVVFHFMAVNSYMNYPNLLLKPFVSYYSHSQTKKALKIADLSLVRSVRDLNVLKKAYKFNSLFLPDAVPDKVVFFPKSSSAFKGRFGIVQSIFFLYIGRLHKLKGPQILVNALQYLPGDYAAVFIGPDDGYLNEIRNLAEKLGVQHRVYLLGYVTEDIKIAAIDSAVALVNPAIADHVEVYSIVLSEAWAREKPVIVSRIGELAYRVEPYVNGLLVEPSNPAMLAKAMVELACNRKLSSRLGENGKKNVCTWATIAMQSIELYQPILELPKAEQ